MTISYVASQGAPLWMFGLPVVYTLLIGLVNYCHNILLNSLKLEHQDVSIGIKEMNPIGNSPATRILIFSIVLLVISYLLPNTLSNPLIIASILLAPAWLLILSLEEKISKAFQLNLWLHVIKIIGVHYWILLITLLTISYFIYYFLLVSGGFIAFILSIYLFLFYHRFMGLILRQKHSLTQLPSHWKLETHDKKHFINKPLVIKYQRILQEMYKSEPQEVFDEKLRLLMQRKNYSESESLFEALTLLKTKNHALNFCQHYLMFLCQNLANHQLEITKALEYCLTNNELFLLEKDMQNVLLAQSLISIKQPDKASIICQNFYQQRADSKHLPSIAKIKGDLISIV